MTNRTSDNYLSFTAAAPTHLIYFTRGGGRTLITATYGEVIQESARTITIQTFYEPVTINRSDLLGRKDKGERFAREEIDAIFAQHGDKQVK